MTGWVYLIRNGDLYKIGITSNHQRRMKQLKPDEVVAKLRTTDFRDLEKRLHKKFKRKRIPQTEYFRLNKYEVSECKRKLSRPLFFFIVQEIPSIISYLLGIILVISAIEPLSIDFARIHPNVSTSLNRNTDKSYPLRLISGIWLAIFTNINNKRLRR